jgi:hypothetical protein
MARCWLLAAWRLHDSWRALNALRGCRELYSRARRSTATTAQNLYSTNADCRMPWLQLGARARKPDDSCGLTQTFETRPRKITRSTRALSGGMRNTLGTLPRRGTDDSTNTMDSVRTHKGVS